MERPRRQPPPRPLVLLNEGHDDTRELYASSLKYLGFETTTVGDGADAYAQTWQTRPDIIVTEVTLPRHDGWDFIRNLKRDPVTREIPIVVVTSCDQASTRERAEQEGCAAFFVKPCEPDQLAFTLRQIVHQSASHDSTSASH